MKPGPLPPLPRWMDALLLPALNVALALLVTAAVIAAIGQSPWQAISVMVEGAFGGAQGWGYTLYYATSFIFTGLGVTLALQAGLFNIGAEGQATVGGLALGAVLLALGNRVHPALALPLATAAALAAGAAWALVPAALQAWRGSSIVITTIMFNFLASSLAVWLLVNVMRAPGGLAAESASIVESLRLPSLQQLLAPLGIVLPRSPLNLAFPIALACCAAVGLLLRRLPLGFALRTLGAAPEVARAAGHDPRRLTLVAMGLSGALAAMLALNEIAGVHHKLLLDFTGGAGFTGIAVALMGRGRPLGIVAAALLFGALYQGGAELAFEMPAITREVVVAVQGLVVLFCGALALLPRPGLVALHALLQRRRAAGAGA